MKHLHIEAPKIGGRDHATEALRNQPLDQHTIITVVAKPRSVLTHTYFDELVKITNETGATLRFENLSDTQHEYWQEAIAYRETATND